MTDYFINMKVPFIMGLAPIIRWFVKVRLKAFCYSDTYTVLSLFVPE